MTFVKYLYAGLELNFGVYRISDRVLLILKTATLT